MCLGLQEDAKDGMIGGRYYQNNQDFNGGL